MRDELTVVWLDRDTLGPGIDVPQLSFPHKTVAFPHTAPELTAERIRDAHIVITNKVRIDQPALESARALRLVAVAATGTDAIDVAACGRRAVAVSNVRDYARNTVPEHTFALILALRRGIVGYRQSVSARRWQQSASFCFFDHPVEDLHGATIGIIGDGVLGRAVAGLARAFGMEVLYAAYKGTSGMGPLYTPFEETLERSDVITLHSPLTPTTRGMIAAPEFARMKRSPVIVNTARGGLVDEDALADALDSGLVSGAGFDVATIEPPPPDHVLMRLLSRPNFILTPHVAWASRQARQALANQLIGNVEAFVGGRPRNLVV